MIEVELSIANVTTDKYVIPSGEQLSYMHLSWNKRDYINCQCIAFDGDITIVCTDFDHISLISKEDQK